MSDALLNTLCFWGLVVPVAIGAWTCAIFGLALVLDAIWGRFL